MLHALPLAEPCLVHYGSPDRAGAGHSSRPDHRRRCSTTPRSRCRRWRRGRCRGSTALRPSLLGRLLRNRRWLGATALGLARVAAGDRGAAAGAADRGAAVHRQRAAAVALARGDEAGGEAGAAGVRARSRRSSVGVARRRLGGARADAPTTPGPVRSRWRWSWWRLPLIAPYALRRPLARNVRRLGLLAVVSAGCGYAWTAIASKLLTDELAAGSLAIAVALAGDGGRLGGPGAAQRDERAAAAAGDPCGADDVRGPGAGAGAAGAADLRRVLGGRRRSAARRWSLRSLIAVAGTVSVGRLEGGGGGNGVRTCRGLTQTRSRVRGHGCAGSLLLASCAVDCPVPPSAIPPSTSHYPST